MPDIYGSLGVESKKVATTSALQTAKMNRGLYPDAFCVLTESSLDHNFLEVHHPDGGGSKDVVNYLLYKETDDPKWFRYSAAGVIAMNVDDMICVGCTGRYNGKEYPIKFTNTVAINKLNMDKKAVLAELFAGYQHYISILNDAGFPIIDVGGEVADLPDQVGTVIFDGAFHGVIPKDRVILGDNVAPGQVIVGFASDGIEWCDELYNSGIMSNGLTLVRCKLLSHEYEKKYPEITSHPSKEPRYVGEFKLDYHIDDLGMTLGEAIVSPTRMFAPLITQVIDQCSPVGLVHITGGGLTKLNSIGKNVQYTLELSRIPPFFGFIQEHGKVSWYEMCKDYNLGVGFVAILPDKESAERAITLSDKFNVGAEIIGKVEPSDKKQVKVTLPRDRDTFEYPA